MLVYIHVLSLGLQILIGYCSVVSLGSAPPIYDLGTIPSVQLVTHLCQVRAEQLFVLCCHVLRLILQLSWSN